MIFKKKNVYGVLIRSGDFDGRKQGKGKKGDPDAAGRN
jgi:hypothetical protein